MKFNVSDTIKKAEKEYGLGKGEYFKVQEGDNKIRLLSECLPHASVYKGQPTFKFVCWVIDRRDQVIKPYFMPLTILKSIESLQISDEYKFDEVPMPYDINIKATNAGTREVNYSVIPARENKALTEEEKKAFAEKSPIDEFQKKLKVQEVEKESEEDSIIDIKDIPF